jgi:hypothetical protein
MGNNRISEHFRNAERQHEPVREWFVVEGEWGSIRVTRETAESIMDAIGHGGSPRFLRVRTILGAEAFIRTDAVTGIEESTPEVRRARRRMWKMLDDEEDRDDNGEWK